LVCAQRFDDDFSSIAVCTGNKKRRSHVQEPPFVMLCSLSGLYLKAGIPVI
jgi:hypothetical protein